MGNGRYSIIDLRPGSYNVTFSLAGFSTVAREGIELTSGFSAAVNAEMTVGAVEETVTVTGATPVVDVQNVRTQAVLTSDVLESVPSTIWSQQNLATMVPGAVAQGTHGRRWEPWPHRRRDKFPGHERLRFKTHS